MSVEKRPVPESFGSSQLVKKPKSDADLGSNNGSIALAGYRSVGLPAPLLELTGHTGEVFACRFDSSATYIASGSLDRSIMLWNVKQGCQNFGVLHGHKGAVLDLRWARDSSTVFSSSADTVLASWDVETGQRLRRHVGHEMLINSMDISKRGQEILASASDDGYIGIWDTRQPLATDFLETEYSVTAVAFPERGHELISGSLDEEIKVWDMRKKRVLYTMKGHTDTITSLEVSPDSNSVLSHSLDATVRTWDIQPYAAGNRLLKTYNGGLQVGIEKNPFRASWDSEGEKIAAGSGDGSVAIWETRTGKLLHKLPGHKGSVNDVRFYPGQSSIVLSGSSDHSMMLGEIAKT